MEASQRPLEAPHGPQGDGVGSDPTDDLFDDVFAFGRLDADGRYEVDEEKAWEWSEHERFLDSCRMSSIPLTEQPPKLLGAFGSTELITMLWGDGGTGKSVIVLACAVSLATGREIIPGFKPSSGPMRVLYLDYEDRPAMNRRRLERLWPGGLDNLFYLRPKASLLTPEGLTEVKGRMLPLHIDAVVIDSVGFACRVSDLVDPAAALDFKTAAQELGVPVISLFHVPKLSTLESPYGSIFWRNVVGEGWSVERIGSEDRHTVALVNRKDNDSCKAPEIGLEIDWSAGPEDAILRTGIEFRSLDAAEVEELRRSSEDSRRTSARSGSSTLNPAEVQRKYVEDAVLVHVVGVGVRHKKADIRKAATSTLQALGHKPASPDTFSRVFSELCDRGRIEQDRMWVWLVKDADEGMTLRGEW